MALIIPTREATRAKTNLIIPDRKPLEFTNADIRKEKGKSIINGMIESGQATTAREPIIIPSRKPSPLQSVGEYISPQPDKVRVVDFVRELGGIFGKITSGAKFIQEEISRSGASVGLTVAGATSGGAKELDISGDEIENKVARVIFGDRPLKSIESRVADAELVLKNYSERLQGDTGVDGASELQKSLGEIGEANSTLLSFLGVGGMISLDFTGAGGQKNAIKALAKSKDFAFISKILRQIGVAEDIITPTASKLVKVSDEKIISKAITKIDDLQKSTNIVKNSLKIPEQPLTKEIQKAKAEGKSFDEFVGSKEKLYHGTDASSASKIEEGGFKFGEGKVGAEDSITKKLVGDVVYFADTSEATKGFARVDFGKKPSIVEASLDNIRLATTEDINRLKKGNTAKEYRQAVEELKKEGFDGLKTGLNDIAIWNINKIKTKSQLKQLWDKGITKVDDIASDIKKAKAEGKSFEEFVEPKTVYHGTNAEFDTFKGGLKGVKVDTNGGFYFSPYKKTAQNFGKNVKEVVLDIKNPKIAKTYREIGTLKKADIDKAIAEGYDGYYFKPSAEDLKSGYMQPYNEEWVAFKPEQIKTKSQLKQLWDKGESINVQINKIKLGDDFADATGDIQKGIKSKTDLPVLLGKEGDEFFVKDGNHRIAEAMRRGENTIKATLDEAEYLKLTKEKKISSLDDIFEVKKTVKPKPLTGKEQIALREEAKFARMEEKAQRESLSFEGELESQYQSFKKLISPSKLDEIADATQLKAKVKANSEEIDNILYSQDKNIDEVFDIFKERRFDETAPFTQIPKETKAVVAEKARQQVKSAKDIIDRRRGFINAAKRQFGLSDTDLKKITRKDIRLMSNIEFKKFIDDLRIGAAKLAKTRDAKNRVLNLVKEKELQKVDALRKAMKLPPINKMSIEELGKLEKELEKAQVGDVFLTTRELETVKKTDLGDIKTIREARVKLAKELGVPVSSLDNIKVSELDRLRFDTALADRNPFYKMLVENTHENILIGEKSFLETETEINKLVTKARKSRKRGIGEKLIPTDKKVFDYLSGNEKLAKEMTSEELELANYLQVKFSDALDYLLKNEVIEKGRSNYITNTRRGFLEAVKEDGIIKSIREVLDAHKQDEQTFQILDRSTGDILPLEKFFQFSLRRTGGIKPTKNVAKAANTYFRTLEKKKALDALIPKMDIYVRSLTPTKLTPKGLEMDRKLKTFVNEWLNNKKGRKTTLIAKQGGKIDIALSTIRSFLYFKDLAFSLPVGLASFVGEQVSTFVNIGNRLYLKGAKRSLTKQGKSIIDKYTNFIGKSVWSELKEPSKNIGDKFTEGMFGAFAQSTREANKIHLLGNLTEAEFKAGAVSPKRLAQMKIEIGKFRMLSEGKSIIGSAPEGQVITQYKTWAIPILRTITKDLSTILKTISKGDIKKAITSTEMKEILRASEISSGVLFLGNKFIDEDDESFIGKMTKRLQQEALTILGALDTKTMLAAPRLTSFVENLGKALSSLIKLEEYKTKKGLVGVGKLKRELKPGFVRQFETKKTASPRAAELKKIFNSGGSQRKTLNEIFK